MKKIIVFTICFILSISPVYAKEKITFSRCVDGDTFKIKVNGEEAFVRMLAIDTPESVKPDAEAEYYGKEASNFTKKELTGKTIWLEYDQEPLDRYKRHLAYIWIKKPKNINENIIRNDMFNAKLLLGGYAKVMNIKPNSKYAEIFKKFQNEAKKSKIGRWK